jgi:hypothetical protein
MAIKKAYSEVIEFLTVNSGSKVSNVLDEVIAMCSAKSGGGGGGGSTSVRRDDEGNVSAVYCYYHKQWEDITEAEYGAKASSPTGLNNMCKEGTSQYSKQQRVAKQARDVLLTQVASGDVAPEDMSTVLADIEADRLAVVDRADGHAID